MPDFDPYGRERQQMPDMTYRDPWGQRDRFPGTNPAGTTSPEMDAFGGIVTHPAYQWLMGNNPMKWAMDGIQRAMGWDKDAEDQQGERQQALQHALTALYGGGQIQDPQLSPMPVMPESYRQTQTQYAAPKPEGQFLDAYRQGSKPDLMSMLQDLAPGHFQPQIRNGLSADEWLDYLNSGDMWGTGGRER